jgi:hypothetical protein
MDLMSLMHRQKHLVTTGVIMVVTNLLAITPLDQTVDVNRHRCRTEVVDRQMDRQEVRQRNLPMMVSDLLAARLTNHRATLKTRHQIQIVIVMKASMVSPEKHLMTGTSSKFSLFRALSMVICHGKT